MKAFIKYLFIVITSFNLIAVACSKVEDCSFDSISLDLEYRQTPQTRSSSSIYNAQKTTVVNNNKINKESLPAIIAGFLGNCGFKDLNKYTQETVTRNGRDLLYVINFNSGGWALISCRKQENNQIIAFCKDGQFNTQKIDCPEVEYWLNLSLSILEAQIIHDEDLFSQLVELNSSKDGLYVKSLRIFDDESYLWVRLPIDPIYTTTDTEIKSHLIPTHWGQYYPWNYLCPTRMGTVCPTGCVPVAISQLLYYLHSHLGSPESFSTLLNISFTWHSFYDDSYYLSSINRSNDDNSFMWGYMPLTNPGIRTLGSDYVGNLMMDVGNYLNTRYRQNRSTGFLYESSLEEPYNISSSFDGYDSSVVVESLNQNMPVVVFGSDPDENNARHCWIIDGYLSRQTIKDTRYQWRMIPPDSLSFYNNIDYDYVLTETQKQQRYPHIQEFDIEHYYTTLGSTNMFRMNWGYDGNYDNGAYSFSTEGWISNYHYYDSPTMFYNFRLTNDNL